MLLISSRKNFWEPNFFSNNEAVKDIDLTIPNDPGTDISDADLLAAVTGKKLHLLIHGYNNDEAAIRNSYAVIESMMSSQGLVGPTAPYDMLLGYVWPGGNLGISYAFAKKRAEKAAPRVQTLLLSIASVAASLDINTHSLGARVALQALKGVPGKPIRDLFMLAPAVDDESIEIGEKFYSSTQACNGAYVFHSKFDPVLKLWFPLGDFDAALGLNGPEDPSAIIGHSPNVKVVNCKKVIKSHSGYKSEAKVYQYWLNELTGTPADQFYTLPA
ncbi:MAG TPA: alpha/beta hydrolase [Blastocatellia bacterium]|nr:alpha/beta hydrolase [Blastocatellia bacterium]